MEIVGIVVVVIGFLVYTFFSKYYENQNQQKEKMMLIRELTTSIRAGKLEEYSQSLPEYYNDKKEEKEIIKDELIEIDQVDPGQLLQAISKK